MTLAEKLEPYGIDPDTAEGLRERLAAGFVYPGPRAQDPGERIVASAKVKLPTGEWVEL